MLCVEGGDEKMASKGIWTLFPGSNNERCQSVEIISG